MAAYNVHSESKSAKNIKLVGLICWIAVTSLGIIFQIGEVVAGGGAVGLCFLIPYLFWEEKSISESELKLRRFFGDAAILSETALSNELDSMDEEESYQYHEAVSDYLSAKILYESDRLVLRKRETLIFAFLTMQWAFASLPFNSGLWD